MFSCEKIFYAMNIKLFIAAALTAVLPALHAFADRVDFFDPNDNMVYIMSHRATTSDTSLPDNSIQGLNAVIDAGADMIEVDVWRTKDGKFIVWHDDRINGKIINDYNYSEFSGVRLSNGEPIPTFEEYLRAGKGRVGYNIDKVGAQLDKVKTGKVPSSFLSEMVQIVRNLDMVDDVLYFTASSEYTLMLLNIEPRAMVGVWGDWSTGFLSQYPNARYYVQCNYRPESAASESRPGGGAYINPAKPACVNLFGSYAGGSPQVSRDKLDPKHIDDILKMWPNTRFIMCDVADLVHADLIKRFRRGIGHGSDVYVTPSGSGDGRGSSWDNAMNATDFRELLWHRGEENYTFSNNPVVQGKTFRLSSGVYDMVSYTWGVKMLFDPQGAPVSFTVEGGYDPTLRGRDLSRKSGRTIFGRGGKEPTSTASAMFWLVSKAQPHFIDCEFDGGYTNNPDAEFENGSTHAFTIDNADVAGGDNLLQLTGCRVHNFNTTALGADGGTFLLHNGQLRLRNTHVTNNFGDNRGAAFQVINYSDQPVSIWLDNCLVAHNRTRGDWGVAAHLRAGSLLANNTTFYDNSCTSGTAQWAVINGSGGGLNASAYLFVNSTVHVDNATSHGNLRLDSDINYLRIYNSVFTNDNPQTNTIFVTDAGKGAQAISAGANVFGRTSNFALSPSDSHVSGAISGAKFSDNLYRYNASDVTSRGNLSALNEVMAGFRPDIAPQWGEEFAAWVGKDGFRRDSRSYLRNTAQMQPGAFDDIYRVDGSLFVTADGAGDGSGQNWDNAISAMTLRGLLAGGLRGIPAGSTLRLAAGNYPAIENNSGIKLDYGTDSEAVNISIEGSYSVNAGPVALEKSENGRTTFVPGDNREAAESFGALFSLDNSVHATFTDCDFDGGSDPSTYSYPLPKGALRAFQVGNVNSRDNISLTLDRCDIRNFNSVAWNENGGAIVMHNGDLRMRDCRITDNAADNRGAALQIINYSDHPVSVMMDRCLVARNVTQGWWGLAMHLRGGSLLTNNTTFAENRLINPDTSIQWALINSSAGGWNETATLFVNTTIHQTNASWCGNVRLDSPVNYFRMINSVVTNDNEQTPSIFITEPGKGTAALSHGYNILGANVNFAAHSTDSPDATVFAGGSIGHDGLFSYDASSLKSCATHDQITAAVTSFSPGIAPQSGAWFMEWVGDEGFAVDARKQMRNKKRLQPGALDAHLSDPSGVENIVSDGGSESETVDVRYYDLMGRRVTGATPGTVVIERSIKKDGSSGSRRIIVR